MIGSIWAITIKEFYQILRDKQSLCVLLFIPALMLILFGYALSFDLRNVALAVYDQDKTAGSRELIEHFTHSGYFEEKYSVEGYNEAKFLLDSGKALTVMVLPVNFEERLLNNEKVGIQFLIDGADSNTAGTVQGYIAGFIGSYTQKLLTKGSQNGSLEGIINVEPRIWYNPGLESADFFVPGLIGFILMITTVVSTSLSIVREKETNTMEQLYASPLGALPLVVGKVLPYILISLFSEIAILVVGYLLFGVEVRGSYFELFVVSAIFISAGVSLGLFFSTLVESQQVAFFVALITSMLPTLILSGFIFPINNMPIWVQVITYITPSRYFIEILRAIILKGVSISDYIYPLLALCLFIIVPLGASVKKMRKKTL